MQNKYNINDVNAWLKEQYGMSYDELSKEFNKAVDLLSESLKQRKEMRNKINEVIEYVGKDCKYYDIEDEEQYEKILNILKEGK